jgi:hypothetical protein
MRQGKPHIKVNPQDIAICHHCGHKAPHKLLHREDFFVDIDKDTIDECWWAIMRCGSCGGMSGPYH